MFSIEQYMVESFLQLIISRSHNPSTKYFDLDLIDKKECHTTICYNSLQQILAAVET